MASATKRKSSPVLAGKAVNNPSELPDEFTSGEGAIWLHHHTHPLAFEFNTDEEKLFDVWEVDHGIGKITRVAVALKASDDPLGKVRDYFWYGHNIAFLTPHIEGDEAEHFLAMLHHAGEWLKRVRSGDINVKKIPKVPFRERPEPAPKVSREDIKCWRRPLYATIRILESARVGH